MLMTFMHTKRALTLNVDSCNVNVLSTSGDEMSNVVNKAFTYLLT